MSMDPVAEDQLGRTMDFMQRIERATLYGDDDILDNSGTDTNYDGLLKSLTRQRAKNVIDLAGKPLNLDTIAGAATKLVTEGKLMSFQDVTLFMSPQNIEDLGKLRYNTYIGAGSITGPGTTVDRADLTTSARNNLIAGLSVVGQSTSFGVIPFEWSIFTEPVESGLPLNLTSNQADTGAPAAPSATTARRSDPSDPGSSAESAPRARSDMPCSVPSCAQDLTEVRKVLIRDNVVREEREVELAPARLQVGRGAAARVAHHVPCEIVGIEAGRQ
jgi:hypothetical protein